MEREQVTSSNVESVGYDAQTKTLEVEFRGGSVYRYHNVPAKAHQSMMAAPSVGRYFMSYIRGVYPTERVDE